MGRFLAFSLLALALPGCDASAQGMAATVELAEGKVAVTSLNGARQAASRGLKLIPGDTIETGGDGELHAVLADGGYLAVRPNSVVRIQAFAAQGEERDEAWIDLGRGALRAVTGWVGKARPAAYRFTTPQANVGVRGTDLDLVHIAEGEARGGELAGTHHWVHEGATVLRTPRGQLELAAGQAAYARRATDAPRLHDGVPAFVRDRQGRFDTRIERHAAQIDEQMTRSLRERGLLKENDSLDKYIERRRGDDRPQEMRQKKMDGDVAERVNQREARESRESRDSRETREERSRVRPDAPDRPQRPERPPKRDRPGGR
jgi:hypothetical protein